MEDLSTDFVLKWTQSPDQDFKLDNRGGKKGRARKWGSMLKERIKRMRQELEANFIGGKYITGRTEPINFIGYSFYSFDIFFKLYIIFVGLFARRCYGHG